MAQLEHFSIEKSRNGMAGLGSLGLFENGGRGSGNFGHQGRPGKRGGSGRGIGAGSLHTSPDYGYNTREEKKMEELSKDATAYSSVMHPTEKLDNETLERGRKVIGAEMRDLDSKLASGERKVLVGGKAYEPWKEDLKRNGQIMATPLTGEADADVLRSVQGQLSDGAWENSPGMESYWQMSEIVKGDDDRVYMNVSRQYDYTDYIDNLGTRHWKNNKYRDMTNDGVRKFWGDKIKQVVDIERRDSKSSSLFTGEEDYSWRPDNNTELQYMHSYNGGKNPTVGDAYKAWAKLVPEKAAKLKRDY